MKNETKYEVCCVITGRKDNLRMFPARNKQGEMIGWVFIHNSIDMDKIEADIKWNFIGKRDMPEVGMPIDIPSIDNLK